MDLIKKISGKLAHKEYTIIAGCGRLGASIADTLSAQGDDVVIIDCNADSFRKLSPTFGGIELTGDATEISVLKEADIKHASSVIAVTNRDNTNIMIAQLAKEVFHIENVIARLYDPECECVYRDFGINTICPVVLSTNKIGNMLYRDMTSEMI